MMFTNLIATLFSLSVTFESIESKGPHGGAVINQVRMVGDTWYMDQFSAGKHDKIKIVVKDGVARFYQKGGVKVACFSCHANGPRAIRARGTSLKDQMVIAVMNTRIKLYGKLNADGDPLIRHHSRKENAPVKFATCQKCHNGEDGFFNRGELTYQHRTTIKHLVATKQMPPWPYKLSAEELKQIESL